MEYLDCYLTHIPRKKPEQNDRFRLEALTPERHSYESSAQTVCPLARLIMADRPEAGPLRMKVWDTAGGKLLFTTSSVSRMAELSYTESDNSGLRKGKYEAFDHATLSAG